MSNKYIPATLVVTLSLFSTSAVHAHSFFTQETSLFAGFLHPWLGLDHLLAMLAVGLWAAQQGSKRLWQLPCAFKRDAVRCPAWTNRV